MNALDAAVAGIETQKPPTRRPRLTLSHCHGSSSRDAQLDPSQRCWTNPAAASTAARPAAAKRLPHPLAAAGTTLRPKSPP
eukprot:CAMPEP_0202865780 /NCGR_PEP_ID=MMETSP1391-20130828/6350_1 /ASSEMBLY_ACC=CAM_ASM_000867 /TAXON_ID=1034604 /ORGANISM="Chlamydomonas leiostraca, Strain SAG 11-49" /LENGTH=80 /DNA_ID=CAMNT_0049545657 /DNA_START=325 /DNA_END=563 /DNA_ORIENTATION=-